MPYDRYPPRPAGSALPASEPRSTRRANLLAPILGSVALVAGLIVLFLIGTTAGNPPARQSSVAAAPAEGARPSTPAPSPTPTPTPGIGKAVRDGKFEFVVSRVDCSQSRVGLERLSHTAKGKFCVVSLSVKNIADRPQLFLGKAQKVVNAAGASFHDDQIAGLYANRVTQTFLRKIDPGDKVVGKLVFDVPKATQLTTVELHDSFFSRGARVSVK
jgi:hypothetical protein